VGSMAGLRYSTNNIFPSGNDDMSAIVKLPQKDVPSPIQDIGKRPG
jgi:hypothetical protein